MQKSAAIPTKYAGTQFRSRLEATWAAMFDECNIAWEYEPFDCNGYIPDFILLGDNPLLIEVKPAVTWADLETYRDYVEEGITGHWAHDFMIVGATPIISTRWSSVTAGLLCDFGANHETWGGGPGIWARCEDKHTDIGFGHQWNSYRTRPCGHYDGNLLELTPTLVNSYWATAKNVTQWNPPRQRR